MKQKELRKIQDDMKLAQEVEYLEANQISKEEYFKAKNKQNKIGMLSIGGLWIGLLLMAVGANIIRANDEAKNAQPQVMKRVDLRDQPSLAFNPNSYIDFYNYSNSDLQYVNVNGTSQPNYVVDFDEAYVRLPYNSNGNATMYFNNANQDDGYFLSDDSNLNTYGEGTITSEEAFNGTMISHYGSLATDMYINLHTPNVSDIYTRWLFNEYLSTNVDRTITKDISYGYFTLDFNDEYVNSYNNFNVIRIEAKVKVIDYGYRLSVSLSAYNTSNSYKTLLATTYFSSKASNNSIIANSNGTFGLSVKNASNLDYRDDFVTMPYLRSLKLHSSSNHPFNYQVSQIGFRSWLDYNNNITQTIPNTLGMDNIDSDRYAENLWGNFGDLMKLTFTSLLPMASIVILPGVTVGAIVIAPFVIGLVILMLRLVKKD